MRYTYTELKFVKTAATSGRVNIYGYCICILCIEVNKFRHILGFSLQFFNDIDTFTLSYYVKIVVM